MNGIFFIKFKEYALSYLPQETWDSIAKEAGVADREYMIDKSYPDNEIFTLIASMASITKKDNIKILEEFGDHISAYFLRAYIQAFDVEALTTIQLFEQLKPESLTEMKKYLFGNVDIPFLDIQRIADNELIIMYKSPRQFCAFLKGIIKGIAKQQNEDIYIEELDCTMNGSTHCRFLIKNVGSIDSQNRRSDSDR